MTLEETFKEITDERIAGRAKHNLVGRKSSFRNTSKIKLIFGVHLST